MRGCATCGCTEGEYFLFREVCGFRRGQLRRDNYRRLYQFTYWCIYPQEDTQHALSYIFHIRSPCSKVFVAKGAQLSAVLSGCLLPRVCSVDRLHLNGGMYLLKKLWIIEEQFVSLENGSFVGAYVFLGL